MNRLISSSVCAALLSTCLWALASVPVLAKNTPEDFARVPEVRGVKLSPQGNYIGVVRIVEDKRVLAILEFPSMKLTGVMSFPGRNQVLNFWWVNDERVVASVTRDFGDREFLIPSGELFGMNADGKKSKHLFGYRAGGRVPPSKTSKRHNEYASARIINRLWDDPDEILIQSRAWSRGFSSTVEALRLNVYSGRVRNSIRAPAAGANFATDKQGNVRFAFSVDDEFNSVVHIRDPETGDWSLFARTAYGDSEITPLAVTPEGDYYVMRTHNEGSNGIYIMDAESKQMTEVYRHGQVDSSPLLDGDDNLWGVVVEPDRPQFISLDADHPHSKLITQLERSFDGRYVEVVSANRDNKLVILRVIGDNTTPEYFLYNRTKNQVQKLFDSLPWIDDSQLARMHPVIIKARDGVELNGYLTLPPGSPGESLPMVIMPHGGPHGIRDSWGYDDQVQLMATHGYAVLQVNYRGSGGYGLAFEKMGYLQWGLAMQDDLTDATDWAIHEGIADPKRICIYGWSYGGYATLMGIVREPDLYQCAVAGAGVYDQDIQYKKADFTRFTRWGADYIDKVIGPTAEDRRRASPITYVDRIKTPLFIAHGEEDLRVPLEHARALVKALKAVGITPQYMEKDNEGHGFFNEENRADFNRALLDFLDKHIGEWRG